MFQDQIAAYLQTLNTAHTHRRYQDALREFERWYTTSYGQPPDATLLTDEEGRDWRSHLLNVRHLSASSISIRLAALRGLGRHFGRDLRVPGVKKVPTPVEPLNGRELGRLLAAADGASWLDKRDVAMLSLMARAGLRVSEVVALRVEDLSVSERKGQIVVRRGKGLKERTVPLSRQGREDLQAYLSIRPEFAAKEVFLSRTGSPLLTRDVQRIVSAAARRAGIDRRVTPHVLRHSFATRALRQGKIDLASLADLLGHESISTTARYLHPDREGVAAMVEEL